MPGINRGSSLCIIPPLELQVVSQSVAQVFIRGLRNLEPFEEASVATIGNFDGVHLGHQAVLSQLKSNANRLGLPALAMIFEPHPREFFEGEQAPPRLMSLRDKVETMWSLGVDRVLCLQFNSRLRSMTAREFVEDVLVKRLHIRCLIVGDDFRFGCDRSGNVDMLQAAGRQHGFEVLDADTYEYQNARVSSTRIRKALATGDFELAKTLLSRPYRISGRVIHGQKLGRQLNMPTANISLQGIKPPVHGVYVALLTVQGALSNALPAVVNVGAKPTVAGDIMPLLEAHVLDWSGDLYGKRVHVEFLHKIRNEQRFSSKDALQQQLFRDRDYACSYFAQEGA